MPENMSKKFLVIKGTIEINSKEEGILLVIEGEKNNSNYQKLVLNNPTKLEPELKINNIYKNSKEINKYEPTSSNIQKLKNRETKMKIEKERINKERINKERINKERINKERINKERINELEEQMKNVN